MCQATFSRAVRPLPSSREMMLFGCRDVGVTCGTPCIQGSLTFSGTVDNGEALPDWRMCPRCRRFVTLANGPLCALIQGSLSALWHFNSGDKRAFANAQALLASHGSFAEAGGE